MAKMVHFASFILSLYTILVVTAKYPHHHQGHHHFDLKSSNSGPHKNSEVFGHKAQTLLPTAVTPEHYTLRIRPILNDPDEDQFTAPGSLQIVLNCHEATSQVTVHKDPSLQVDETSISFFHLAADGSHGDQIDVVSTSYDQPTVFYTILLATPLQPGGRYELSLNFVAEVNRGRSGLYRAQYQTPEGQIRYMATTQFQSFGARLAFPCFDEPGLKATFDVTIGRRRELNSMTNTLPKELGVEDPVLPDGWVWDVYNRTMPMSSYLLAIIVSDFVCETADPSIFDGRPVRVCGAPHQIVGQKGGVYPAEAAARSMKFLEETFKYPYEMYKLDNAAIPLQYFAPGAMENWGMVTYGDTRIMFYEDETEQNRYNILSIIGHELAHQWFGNLITFATWGNVWLSEGFATYISYMVVNELAPEFETTGEIYFEEMQRALEFDVGVDDPVFNEDFDSSQYIIYNKAAALVRMIQGFLGKDLLLDTLVKYLERHAYQPVNQDQLFSILSEFGADKLPADVTIKQIMDTWTLQPGYPLLRVSQYDDSHVYISQEKFLPASAPPTDSMWEVPVTIATGNNPDFSNHTPALWLTNNSAGILFEHKTNNWIVLNPDTMAFYRVLYDDDLLTLIHDQLATSLDNLSGMARSQIIDDYFNFAYHGHEPIDKAMELTKYLENEDEPIVWRTVFYYWEETVRLFDVENHPEFSDYLLPKIESVLNRLLVNWSLPLPEIGSGSKTIFVATLLDMACQYKSPNCKALASSLTNQWMEAPEKLSEIIPADFEVIMLCHGVAELGQVAYDFIQAEYVKADPYGLHKGRFMQAIVCSQSANLEGFLLENFFKLKNASAHNIELNSLVQSEIFTVFLKAIETPGGRPIVMKILRSEVHQLKNSFGEDRVAQIVTLLSQFYKTQMELDEMEKLVQELNTVLPDQIETLNEALNNIQANMDWVAGTGMDIQKWLWAINSA